MKIKRKNTYYRNKRLKNIKLLFLVFLILCSTAGLYIAVDRALEPVLNDIARIRVKEAVAEAINEAVYETIAENDNDNFFKLERDNNGCISSVSANTIYLNEFSSAITEKIHNKLKHLKSEKIKIPIGSIVGSNILSQTGPSVNLKIEPIGNAVIDFSTDFESAGINQTKYKVFLTVKGKAKPVIPFVSDVYEITSNIPIAETVIVGNVPDTFLSLPNE